MRLLHTEEHRLGEFFDHEIKPYAILSHRWANEEPSYQDMCSGHATSLHGYKKIVSAAQQAAEDGFEYIWVDTICIDKTSSAELSEAINSMFRWYAESQVCYAFLEDVEEQDDCGKSKWFTRGWTLQELLAPENVVFYNKQWKLLGSKEEAVLLSQICMACGISEDDHRVLTHFQPDEWSVAKRMSWAAHRRTTRREDIAYCLLGIFNINMPLLYGEGGNAFRRLQEEILRVSDDRSIFAWLDNDIVDDSPNDILARSPAQFAHTGSFSHGGDFAPLQARSQEPSVVTSRGISLDTTLVPYGLHKNMYYAFIGYEDSKASRRPAILVRRAFNNVFYRIYCDSLPTLDASQTRLESRRQQLIFRQLSKYRHPYLKSEAVAESDAFWVDSYPLLYEGLEAPSVTIHPWRQRRTHIEQLKDPRESWTFTYPGSDIRDQVVELKVTMTGISLSTVKLNEKSFSKGPKSRQLLFADAASGHSIRTFYSSHQKEVIAQIVERVVPTTYADTRTGRIQGHFYTVLLRVEGRESSIETAFLRRRWALYYILALIACLLLATSSGAFKAITGPWAEPFSVNDLWSCFMTFMLVWPVVRRPAWYLYHRSNTAVLHIWADYRLWVRDNHALADPVHGTIAFVQFFWFLVMFTPRFAKLCIRLVSGQQNSPKTA